MKVKKSKAMKIKEILKSYISKLEPYLDEYKGVEYEMLIDECAIKIYSSSSISTYSKILRAKIILEVDKNIIEVYDEDFFYDLFKFGTNNNFSLLIKDW
jgi:hypothetical protein